MGIIYQGDQYALPFTVTAGETVITPGLITSLRVKIGNLVKYYPGEITNDGESWYFPLTREETESLVANVERAQIQIQFSSGDIVSSSVKDQDIGYSILKGEWANG